MHKIFTLELVHRNDVILAYLYINHYDTIPMHINFQIFKTKLCILFDIKIEYITPI